MLSGVSSAFVLHPVPEACLSWDAVLPMPGRCIGHALNCSSFHNEEFTWALMEDLKGNTPNMLSGATSAPGGVSGRSLSYSLLTTWHCQYPCICFWAPWGQTCVFHFVFSELCPRPAYKGHPIKKSPCPLCSSFLPNDFWLRWIINSTAIYGGTPFGPGTALGTVRTQK